MLRAVSHNESVRDERLHTLMADGVIDRTANLGRMGLAMRTAVGVGGAVAAGVDLSSADHTAAVGAQARAAAAGAARARSAEE